MSKITPRGFRYVLRLALAVFCVSEIASYLMTEAPIGYQFYNHLQLETFRIALTSFPLLSLVGLVGFILTVYLFTRLSRLKIVTRFGRSQGRYAAALIILAALMAWPGGIVNNIYKVIDGRLAAVGQVSPSEAFSELGLDIADYTFSDQVEAAPGKNIIIISLESFERSILDRGDLAPELRALKEKWTYLPNFKPSSAAATTIAALYAWQTGLPQYFGRRANNLFSQAQATRVLGLGNVLGAAGYNRHYILGEPNFAGSRQFLELYGYTVSGGYDDFPFEVEKPGSFGPYDADLMALAKLEYAKLKDRGQPFLLAVSTVDTHLPGSRTKPDLARSIPFTGDIQVDAVNATSYVVADFIEFIKARGDLEQTAIFIMPDHLIPQEISAKRMGLDTADRSLFLLTNVPEADMPFSPATAFRAYQLPGLILKATGVVTTARFPSELPGADFNDVFLEHNSKKFIKLNQALWVFDEQGQNEE